MPPGAADGLRRPHPPNLAPGLADLGRRLLPERPGRSRLKKSRQLGQGICWLGRQVGADRFRVGLIWDRAFLVVTTFQPPATASQRLGSELRGKPGLPIPASPVINTKVLRPSVTRAPNATLNDSSSGWRPTIALGLRQLSGEIWSGFEGISAIRPV